MPIEIKELQIKASISCESKGQASNALTEGDIKRIKNEVLKEVMKQMAIKKLLKEER